MLSSFSFSLSHQEVLKYQIVYNFGNAQILIVLLIAADRYCSLFLNYSPNYKSTFAALTLVFLPYLVCGLFFDVRILQLVVPAPVSIAIW
ncbi:unnamed protein product [Gongylonema pulchrum]|uniref:G_PROTEIN_RECEP_F1_2 domain-containing protein n=1 Tax=Gongylonema pulchrum TaxID=637853 RepID=A0A183ETZ6_9BILA|nr:unnamed protein product [Gongylonema pulchrum]